jgi:hypothetical protein
MKDNSLLAWEQQEVTFLKVTTQNCVGDN